MNESVIARAREQAKRLKEVNEPYRERAYEDRVKRAKRHAREIFGIDMEPESGAPDDPIVFAVEGVDLVYVGDWDGKKFTYIGRGFSIRERCANCERPQLIRIVKTLAQLGQYLEDDPSWECQFCNEKAA